MQIVFTHFHLNRGGVTSVIVNQLRALAQLPADSRPTRAGVLYGGRHDSWPARLFADEEPFPVELIVCPELDYDEVEYAAPDPLAQGVQDKLQAHGFGADDTILHVHNHALGKNVSWPGALHRLADSGYRLLLQIHDFAEDFRPANYRRLMHAYGCEEPAELAKVLYPTGTGVHYAALTQRDVGLLQSTGMGDDRLHLLPNPIGLSIDLPDEADSRAKVRQQLGLPADSWLVIYPVRGIRRKNLGELLLLAALSDEHVWHGVTLAPLNPLELGPFQRWRNLADELDLRCRFDVCGAGHAEFPEVVAACDTLLTTSVAEGFGMVFLEGWLAGKPLVGRDLPEITNDAVAAGLRLESMYERLAVPIDWVGGQLEVREDIYQAYQWACHDYGMPVDERDEVVAELDRLMDQGTIDFAHLPTVHQQRLIRKIAGEAKLLRSDLCALNPRLEPLLTGACDTSVETIAANAQVVRDNYSMAVMSERLRTIYGSLLDAPAGRLDAPLPSGERILADLLRLSRLHPLRLET